MTHPSCYLHWRAPREVRRFRTAVSLHSHTNQSKELLDFIPRMSRRVPLLHHLVRAQEEKYERLHGRPLNYARCWWTPPLSPREAYTLEQRQIESTLGLGALVSISDHDDIEAPVHLRVLSEFRHVPISLEWTVPFGCTFFHIGVHNLPAKQAHAMMDILSTFTSRPDEALLSDVLGMLNSCRSTLVVLNHPLWDETAIGSDLRRKELTRFTSRYRRFIHAAELNGLRPMQENIEVTKYAQQSALPVISGGDRHGTEPNANVNLTNASNFDEFVDEVRAGRQSNVLFLNQYREPIRLRIMQGLTDAIREYPEFPTGRKLWTDRVFFQGPDGSTQSLSSVWMNGGPLVVRGFLGGVRLLQSRRVRFALRMALAERQEGVT